MFAFALSLALAADPSKPVAVGSQMAAPPTEWVAVKPANRLRSHQFKLPAGTEGVADAEVAVSQEASPDTKKYFPIWKGQYVPPEGKSIDEVASESKFEAGKATVHLLDVSGTWKYRDRPNDPKSKEELRTGYRTVWAVVVEKETATHIRFCGPEVVVGKYYKGFEGWLKALK